MKKPANLLLALVMTLLSLPSVAHSVCNPEEAEAGLVYPHEFAPSEGFVNRTESDFRHEICLNGYWDFQPVALPADYRQGEGKAPQLTMPKADGWEKTRIKVPSPWNINAFANRNLQGPDHRNFPSYPQSWEDVKMAWHRKMVTIPNNWQGERIVLHFEAVAGCTDVFVNGKKAGENFDLFLPFEVDITKLVAAGEQAEILVGVRSQKVFEDNSTIGRRIVPAGSMFGYDMNGIWQDVYLLARPVVSISDVYVKPLVGEGVLEIEATISNNSQNDVNVTLHADVREWQNLASTDINNAPVPAWQLGETRLQINTSIIYSHAGEDEHCVIRIPVGEGALKYWTPETPNLYALLLTMESMEKKGKKTVKHAIDRKYERFGWREWTIQGTSYCLNGKPYELKSDSWHFMGVPQMTRRYAWAWYKAIKEMNGNAVRLHAQVYPRLYHDMADEMGICILDETANWASDGGPKFDSELFWQHSREHLARFVQRDRNHPSVFGWSISNENRPVILYVFERPDLMPQQREAWKEWLGIVRENDTTRPWISSDGEDDGDGILPVTIGHYGDLNAMRNWKQIGKPWGIGETSMAYYGTPQQIAKVNGERAYESMLGRMEGLAVESYDLIREMRQMGASYSTVFNMAWYALQPLPLGKRDITAAPSITDGIWFGTFKEGQPGIQPERIGPYCTTFNPGYDPSLPLYKPWPMYEAMRAVNAGDAPAWSPYAEVDTMQYRHKAIAEVDTYDAIRFVGSSESELKKVLDNLGVEFATKAAKKGRTLYIIDATDKNNIMPPKATTNADFWFWGVTPDTEWQHFPLLTSCWNEIGFDKLGRSSFLPTGCSWVSGMQNSDFYFCEVQNTNAADYTLKGAFVDEGKVLLNACRTDWRAWNRQAEEIKTASLLRSEYETTQALPVFVKKGNIFISTLSNSIFSHERGLRAFGTILKNAGVRTPSAPQGGSSPSMGSKNATSEGGGLDADALLLDPSVDTSKKSRK